MPKEVHITVILLILLHEAQLQSPSFSVSFGREAGSNDITLRCRDGTGSIVRNPDFWVNLTDATLRSMLADLGVQHQYRGNDGELQFSIQQDLEGYYYCSRDINSGIISSNATLLANPRPDPNMLTSYSIKVGETIRLPCGVGPGALASHYTVQWIMGNRVLDTANPGPRLSIDLSDFSLTIEDVQPDDEVSYRCRVVISVPMANPYHVPDTTLTLLVYKEPEIVTMDPPQRIENVFEGSVKDADFVCTATGDPRPERIQWMHNSRSISELRDGRFSISPIGSTPDSLTSRLTIQRIQATDSGTVECVAESSITLGDGEVQPLRTTRKANLSVLTDGFELTVTITREGKVQLRLTDPSLGAIPLPVRLKIRYVDAVRGVIEERIVDGTITDSANIFYEDGNPPYQRFRVQVALVVGNVTGPHVPSSLEDASVHDSSVPSPGQEDSNGSDTRTIILSVTIGGAVVVAAVLLAVVLVLLKVRRRRLREKWNVQREEEAKKLESQAKNVQDPDERDRLYQQAADERRLRVAPDHANPVDEDASGEETAKEMVANGNIYSGHSHLPTGTANGELPSHSYSAVANEYVQPPSHTVANGNINGN